MMGPALVHLFAALNERNEHTRTAFENALYTDLVELARLAERTRKSASWLEDRVSVQANRELSPNAPTLKTYIDLGPGGWVGPAKLQLACSFDNCPNKER